MMKTGILTLKSFMDNARAIGGRAAQLSTTGPVHDPPDALGVFLHPSDDGRAWEDDAHQVVATADQVRAWPLDKTVVFLGVCYGLENRDMIDALFEAGARAVIAGPGDNYGGTAGILAGADILAKALFAGLSAGMDIDVAWRTAQTTVQLAAQQDIPGAMDALGFKLLVPATPETDHKQTVRRPRAWLQMLAGLLSLIVLWVTLLLWSPHIEMPGLLTTFSSILPPAGLTQWSKDVYRDGTPVATWWSTPVVITNTNTLMVIDQVSGTVGYTLTETWDTSALSLTTYSASAGSTTPGSGSLVWTAPAGNGTLTKTWSVVGTWSTSTLTEVLQGTGINTQTVDLVRQTPPTPTPTASPTQTPRAKPTRIDPAAFYGGTPEVWITPYATPYLPDRPIVAVYLPLVMFNYAGTAIPPTSPEIALTGPATAYSGQALDYTLTVTGTQDGVHTIIVTLPQTTTLVSATPSGYTQSGYDPVVLTWVEEDLETWDGTVRVIAPTLSVTETITARLRVLWESASVTEDVATTVAP
ncbi:MAG: hypothetical protein M0R37_10665 [Bacteroidales bacterium]|jgi:hypothetical protein|nr:hypothetical protein [Bacteroidales bacterium]